MGQDHDKRQIWIHDSFVPGNDNGFGTAGFELTDTPSDILQRIVTNFVIWDRESR